MYNIKIAGYERNPRTAGVRPNRNPVVRQSSLPRYLVRCKIARRCGIDNNFLNA
jgi:hypothetical protein